MNTFATDISTTDSTRRASATLLDSLLIAAANVHLELVEPIESVGQLSSQHSVDVKHNLVALSCVRHARKNLQRAWTTEFTRSIRVIAAACVGVAVPWEVTTVL